NAERAAAGRGHHGSRFSLKLIFLNALRAETASTAESTRGGVGTNRRETTRAAGSVFHWLWQTRASACSVSANPQRAAFPAQDRHWRGICFVRGARFRKLAAGIGGDSDDTCTG